MSNTIALIAHDTRIDDLVSFVLAHAPTLTRYQLVATATTGKRLQSATGLRVEQKLAGSLGGDVQIAAEVAAGNVIAVIFLVEPFAQSQPSPDTLVHLCQVHNVAIASLVPEAHRHKYRHRRSDHQLLSQNTGCPPDLQSRFWSERCPTRSIVDSAISRASS